MDDAVIGRSGRWRAWETIKSFLGLDAQTRSVTRHWKANLRTAIAIKESDLEEIEATAEQHEIEVPYEARKARTHLDRAKDALAEENYSTCQREVSLAKRYVFTCQRELSVSEDGSIPTAEYGQTCAEVRRLLEHHRSDLDEKVRQRADRVLARTNDSEIGANDWDTLFADVLNLRLREAVDSYKQARRLDSATRYVYGLILVLGLAMIAIITVPALVPDLSAVMDVPSPILLTYVALFGVVGASVSGLFSLRDIISGEDEESDVIGSLFPMRIMLGAVAAVTVLALSFAAGFSERLLVRALQPLIDDEA